ncbi:MAG: leucine-rich repeat domain-containing protein, partial [Methanocorpusculum sp.]|nr:leucine-rich repeat domain-containing protein [Methanocorpusculum sp.]
MKKLLFTFLAAMCCMVMNAQTAFEVDGIKYSVTSENTVEVVANYSNYTGDVVIPSTVTSDGIAYDVTSIGNRAFYFCSNLASVTIPKSVNSIGAEAFIDCVSLASITVAKENTVYESPDNCNAIIEKSTHTLLWGCKNTVIPNTVTNINRFAFRKHTGLTSITIPESVKSIGDGAFQSTGLTSVIIGKSVETIGENAFKNCQGMTEIDVLATAPPTLGYDAFDIVPKDIPVYVPDVDAYKKISWGGFTNLIKYVDLPTAKEEAIAGLQTFINEEKIANAPIKEYANSINAATAKKDIPSIVKNIKDGISNSDKFTLGEWKYLLDKNDEKYTIVGGSLTFTDKELYQSGNDFTANNLTYSRTFEATDVWQAWFVPFDVPISYMNAAGMKVAEIAGVLMDENKQPYIAFAKMTNTDDIAKMTSTDAIVKANTPYVVKATESSVSMTLTGPDIRIRKSTAKELEAQRLTVQSSYNTFTFGGNYQQTNDYANKWYALNTNGIFQKMGEGVELAPQRFWMTIDTRTDTPYYTKESDATAKAFIGMTVLGDDEPTGIESLTPTLSEGNGVIYNLQGQRVT